ncbi:hypothetical protein P692DRAFT_20910641 [Suillus brevipes Sb2]|nr:hypothetical protein P692DRAFT_20910641 [Suillus brevipes Sb2]
MKPNGAWLHWLLLVIEPYLGTAHTNTKGMNFHYYNNTRIFSTLVIARHNFRSCQSSLAVQALIGFGRNWKP